MRRTRLSRACRLAGAVLLAGTVSFAVVGCGQSIADAGGENPRGGQGAPPGGGGRPGGGRGGPPGGFPGMPGFGGPSASAAIAVKVTSVGRRDIADYLETNGSLEAENEVDIVARTTGPIIELNVEEGDFVRAGDVLARIDAAEIQAQLGIARVALADAKLAWDRAQSSFEEELISQEAFDAARSALDSAAAQIVGTRILLEYTVIEAPFDGLIIERVVKNAEYVANGARLFRISDFDPLLCPIQLPEKDLPRLAIGQPAHLTVEAFPGRRFPARVLRISPVVDAATGTVKVTLEVEGQGQLRPGMFASVFVETDVHENAIVVPRQALVLESTSDLVYVVENDAAGGFMARRRAIELGYEESEDIEVLSGLAEGEDVVIIGQDGLWDQTPVMIPEREGTAPSAASAAAASVPGGPDGRRSAGGAGGQDAGPPAGSSAGPGAAQGEGAPPAAAGPGRPGGPPSGFFDPSQRPPERIERIRTRMKANGLSDEQIDQRIEARKNGEMPPGRPPGGGPPGRRPPA